MSVDRAADHDLAADLATRAGQLLLQVRGRDLPDAAARKAAGDAESHAFLTAQLAELCPGDAVLSEEGADDAARLTADRVWIVDPLDGTREFSEPDRADWAVHVALWAHGELGAGAVALPAEDATIDTGRPPTVPARAGGPIRLAVSRSRPPVMVAEVATR
ncbi:inositol monophosphatase family protein, partial [Modestobacter roseus]|uniref:inositol monophosphatase family protein n=1 Tax=Modestobacter roseus TaxID=1181884 RepID=UPI001325278F